MNRNATLNRRTTGLAHGCNMKRYRRGFVTRGSYRVPLHSLGMTSDPKEVAQAIFGQKSIWVRKGADRW